MQSSNVVRAGNGFGNRFRSVCALVRMPLCVCLCLCLCLCLPVCFLSSVLIWMRPDSPSQSLHTSVCGRPRLFMLVRGAVPTSFSPTALCKEAQRLWYGGAGETRDGHGAANREGAEAPALRGTEALLDLGPESPHKPRHRGPRGLCGDRGACLRTGSGQTH